MEFQRTEVCLIGISIAKVIIVQSFIGGWSKANMWAYC